jgi:alpha/beta superfamily hydrolase
VSFGAWVALPVGCADPRVRCVLGAGIPAASLHMEALAGCAKPKLIIQGEHDEYAALAVVRAWYDALPPPKVLTVVPGADHLFTGHLDVVRAAVGQWLAPIIGGVTHDDALPRS